MKKSARMRGFQELVSVDDALKSFLRLAEVKPRSVTISLQSCLQRVLCDDLVSETDLPRVDRSAMDGYAVDFSETVAASQSKPVVLRLTTENKIGKGAAKQVWTGNSIPRGANSVVMLENTKLKGSEIEVWVPLTRRENVSKRGEDVHKGEIAVKSGIRLKPQHLGLAAALGVAELKVFDRPKIGILATGNELAPLGTKLGENQVYETNKLTLSALCTELGAETIDLGIARDDQKEIYEKLKLGLKKSDAIITSGGTSVGGPDLVPETADQLGKPGIIAHGVAMRPGMPTALGVVETKPILILPGNPVASMLGFEVFGRPLICKLLGLKQTESRPVIKAVISKRITTTLGRKNLVRVHVFQRGRNFVAEPISARGSGVMSTMTRANGYVVVPESLEGLEKGNIVLVHMFDVLETVVETNVQETVDV